MLTKRAHVRKPLKLRVVGLDPGLANLGLGAVVQEHQTTTYLGSQLVRTSPRESQSERLKKIYNETKTF